MVLHVYNPSTQEAEAERMKYLRYIVRYSLRYIVRPCEKTHSPNTRGKKLVDVLMKVFV